MIKSKYDILFAKMQDFFNVNDDLRNELNDISIREHNLTLDNLIVTWCKSNSELKTEAFSGVVSYLDMLNNDPHSISEMQEMYDFIYDCEVE